MENKFQLILYLIFGVIYVISRFMKNKNKQTPQVGQERYEDNTPKRSPASFEDLLKEFTGEHVEEKQIEEKKEKQSYEFEENTPSDNEIDEVYQKSIQEAEPLEADSLRHDVEFKRFNEFKIEEESGLLDEILDDLSDENGLKKAVIFKEILDKKY